MIFNVPGHIDMIRNGTKTQTRRMKRSYYQIEAERKNPHEIAYAVQRKRGVKAEPDIRIVMDKIWHETTRPFPFIAISPIDAWAEGRYTPLKYEKVFREINPKWNETTGRWVFKFHVIEVRNV